MKKNVFGLALLAAASIGVSAQAVVVYSGAADASPYLNTGVGFPPGITFPTSGGDGVNAVTGDTLQTANPYNQQNNAVFVFQLPSLGAVSNPFDTASFSATIQSTGGDASFSYNPYNNHYDLYGLTSRASDTVLASDFYIGTNDGAATSVADNFVNGFNYANGTTLTTGGTSLLDYLNAQYAGGAGAGQYVFLRVNPDFTPTSFTNVSLYSGEVAETANRAALTYTTVVPEPTAALFGFAVVPALLRRRAR